MKKIKVAIIQMKVNKNKKINIQKSLKFIQDAKTQGAKIVALPEMFNCPYDKKYFKSYAEFIDLKQKKYGETILALSKAALDNDIYIIGGSIPEKNYSKDIYNTCVIFDNSGKIIGKYRKTHLFDINIKGKIAFKESEVLTKGESIEVFNTKYCKIGVLICYDIRFPEMARIMALKGVKIIFVPGAFNMVTGPRHWDNLFKIRSLDNGVYMVGISPARDENFNYVAYGHSLICNPWGDIIASLDEKEGMLIKEIDFEYQEKINQELPLLKHRRVDIYKIRY